MPPVEFLVDRREAGRTIAALLRERFHLTWSQAKRLVERGHVRVAGFAVSDPGHRVRARNRIWIREGVVQQDKETKFGREAKPSAPRQPDQAHKPKDRRPARTPKPNRPKRAPEKKPLTPSPPHSLTPSDLLYSDDAVVVANKPAGMTTMRHSEEADEFGPRGKRFLPKTLADLLPRLLGEPNARVIPVHRIDRDTSGVVVFARTPAAAEHLTKQFRKHTADRRYLALVRGHPRDGRIESVFVRDRGDGRRGSSPDPNAPGGKRAVTHVRVLERLGPFALVECRLETGRTHQVRIHLGESGAPLCGERVYDRPVHGKPPPDGSGAGRPMLHAARLGFVHPETGERVSWEAPPPEDFTRLFEELRKRANS
jgi:23S rRNA pseudouridine1911/1915/1917 synthase